MLFCKISIIAYKRAYQCSFLNPPLEEISKITGDCSQAHFLASEVTIRNGN